MLKLEPEKRGFQHLPRGPADANISEKHVWLHKTFCCSKNFEKMLWKVIFCCAYDAAERSVTCKRFENAASRAKTNVILTSRNYLCYSYVTDYDVSFCDGPEMLILKTAKPCINSTWIALFLIHPFLRVKTWLLKACDTAFYVFYSHINEEGLKMSSRLNLPSYDSYRLLIFWRSKLLYTRKTIFVSNKTSIIF